MSSEKPPPRPGSARAKLEAFERAEKGRKGFQRKMIILMIFLAAIVVIQLVLSSMSEDKTWFDLPKNASYWAREGKWDEVAEVFGDDFKVEGRSDITKSSLLALLKSRDASGVDLFTTQPHQFGREGDNRWLKFWVVYSRGDLEKKSTIPLVKSWHVYALLSQKGGRWVVESAQVTEAIPDPK